MRLFKPEDIAEIVAVFREAVMSTAADYNETQRKAWAAFGDDERIFLSHVGDGVTLVAEDNEGIVAFGQLHPESHINLLYCRPRGQGKGFATRILEALEAQAQVAGSTALTVEASLTAVRFFEKHGFRNLGEEVVLRKGVALRRYRMRKPLNQYQERASE